MGVQENPKSCVYNDTSPQNCGSCGVGVFLLCHHLIHTPEAFRWLGTPTPLTHPGQAGGCDSESHWLNQSLDLEDVMWIHRDLKVWSTGLGYSKMTWAAICVVLQCVIPCEKKWEQSSSSAQVCVAAAKCEVFSLIPRGSMVYICIWHSQKCAKELICLLWTAIEISAVIPSGFA